MTTRRRSETARRSLARTALVAATTAVVTVSCFVAMLFTVVAFDVADGVMPLGEVSDAATAVRDRPVYVAPEVADQVDEQGLAALTRQVERADQPTRVVLWPDLGSSSLRDVATTIARASGEDTRVLVITPPDDPGLGVGSTLDEQPPELTTYPAGDALTQTASAALTALDDVAPSGEPPADRPGVAELSGAAALALAVIAMVVLIVVGGAAVVVGTVLLGVLAVAAPVVLWAERRRTTLAAADLAPSRARRRTRGAYIPSSRLLLRLNRTRAGERTQRLRSELLALGERIDAHEGGVVGPRWQSVLDCYQVASRIADTTEGRDDLSARADVVAGLVLVLRGSDALEAIQQAASAQEPAGGAREHVDCFANPFHGRAIAEVATIRLGSAQPPPGTRERVPVCSTCASAVGRDLAAADPLALEHDGALVPYWMLGVAPWSQTGYGATSPDLITSWNRAHG